MKAPDTFLISLFYLVSADIACPSFFPVNFSYVNLLPNICETAATNRSASHFTKDNNLISWLGYGDGYLDTSSNSNQFKYAVNSNAESLEDIWTEFTHARLDASYPSKIDMFIKDSSFYKNNPDRMPLKFLSLFPILSHLPEPLRSDEVVTDLHTRNGSVFSFNIGSLFSHDKSATAYASLEYFLGFNIDDAPKDDLNNESNIWIGIGTESLFSSIGCLFLAGVKSILLDRIVLGLSIGTSVSQNFDNNFISQVILGYEFKPVDSYSGLSLYGFYHSGIREFGVGFKISHY